MKHMARRRRDRRPMWVTLPLWGATVLLVGWGLRQFAQFRQTLLAEGEPPERMEIVPAPEAATMPAATIPATQTADADDIDNTDPSGAGGGNEAPTVEIDANEEADALISKGVTLLDAGRIIEGRTDLNSALELLADVPDSDGRSALLRRQL